MSQSIIIPDHTATRLAQLQAITGHTLDKILDHALADHLAHLEYEALRAAVREGAADADAGRFADDYSLQGLINGLNAESGQ